MQPRYLIITVIVLLLISGIIHFKTGYHTHTPANKSINDSPAIVRSDDSISPAHATILTID